MSHLLVTVARRRRHAPPRPAEPTRTVAGAAVAHWHDDAVTVAVEGTIGQAANDVLAASDRWVVAVAGWVTTAADLATPIGAAGLVARLERHGATALGELGGQHLVVAVDRVHRRWWAVRDGAGAHGAFWASGPAGVAIGDRPAEVAAAAGLPRDPDLGHLAAVLALGPPADDTTPLAGLRRLVGGDVLRGDAPAVSPPEVLRWWDPPRPSRVAPQTVEGLRATLRAVVAGATAAGHGRPLLCELSGGLDSSLLTALAADVATETSGPPPVAVTLVHGRSGDTDPPFAGAVARALGIDHRIEPWRPRTPDEIAAECEGGARLPDPANAFGQLFDVAAVVGASGLLRGVGGDQWLNGWPAAAAVAAVRAGQPGRLVDIVDTPDVRSVGRLLVHSSRATVSAVAGGTSPWRRRRDRRVADAAPWLPDELRRTHRVAERAQAVDHRWPPADALSHVAVLGSGWDRWMPESYGRAASRNGRASIVPWWHRAVVADAIALPEPDRWAAGDRRHAARRLLPPSIPDVVRNRADKGDFTDLFAAEAMWSTLGPVRTWQLVAVGLIDRRSTVAGLAADDLADLPIWDAWQLSAAEWCLRLISAPNAG